MDAAGGLEVGSLAYKLRVGMEDIGERTATEGAPARERALSRGQCYEAAHATPANAAMRMFPDVVTLHAVGVTVALNRIMMPPATMLDVVVVSMIIATIVAPSLP